jgi:hypothetical protein
MASRISAAAPPARMGRKGVAGDHEAKTDCAAQQLVLHARNHNIRCGIGTGAFGRGTTWHPDQLNATQPLYISKCATLKINILHKSVEMSIGWPVASHA